MDIGNAIALGIGAAAPRRKCQIGAKTVGTGKARPLAKKLVRKTYDWDHDPKKLYELRRQMAEALDGPVAQHP